MKFKPFTPKRFRRRVFSQLWMLALQFLLGMLLNFIGADATGTNHTIYIIVLILHILNALGLVEGNIYIALKEKSKLSWYAVGALIITFCAGILTVFTKQDIWSFVMACGFLASCWLNGMLYIQADHEVYSVNSPTSQKKRKK